MLLQALIPQGKASFIPVQHLQFIPLFIAEHKQRIPERIQFHLLFHHDNQAIDGFTEVDIAQVKINVRGLDEHPHSFSAFIRSANQCGLTLAGMRNVEAAHSSERVCESPSIRDSNVVTSRLT